MQEKNAKKTGPIHKILTALGIILCVILVPILIMNCVLLVQGYTNEDKVPSIGGYSPMIVLTDSMVGDADDCFDGGDLIFIKSASVEDVKVGDVITFYDPAGSGKSVLSHRAVEIVKDDAGKIIGFTTKGDNNNSEDPDMAPADKLIGIYTGFRIPNAGSVAMFMQTTTGLIVCVALPVILLVGYDAIRRAVYNKKHSGDKEALLAELEELKRQKAELENVANKTEEKAPAESEVKEE